MNKSKTTSVTDPIINYFGKRKHLLFADYYMGPRGETKIKLQLENYYSNDCDTSDKIYSGTMLIEYSEARQLSFKVGLIPTEREIPELTLLEVITEHEYVIFEEALKVIEASFKNSPRL